MELGPGEVHSFIRAQRSQILAFNLLVSAEEKQRGHGKTHVFTGKGILAAVRQHKGG